MTNELPNWLHAALVIVLIIGISMAMTISFGKMLRLFVLMFLPSVAFGTNPTTDIATDRVDSVEHNFFYDEKGQLVFEQLIYREWDRSAQRHQVRAWRLVKKPTQIPERDWQGSDYLAVWLDGEIFRKVRARTLYRTYTQVDPELIEREWLAKERRRELTPIQPPQQITARPE